MEDDNELVGFRFYPTEEELLCFYLHKKLNGPTPDIDRVIPLVPIYDYSPWELPPFAGEVCRGDTEQWFFFTAMQEREARGGRPNRLTANGYWKATGSPSHVFNSQNLRIGRKKTMVFYEGRAPLGVKTTWKMNEYKLYHESQSQSDAAANPQLREEVSLCRIYKRSKFARALDRRPAAEEAMQVHHHHSSSDEATIDDDDQINAADYVEINDEELLMDWDMEATEEVGALEDSDIEILLKWFDL